MFIRGRTSYFVSVRRVTSMPSHENRDDRGKSIARADRHVLIDRLGGVADRITGRLEYRFGILLDLARIDLDRRIPVGRADGQPSDQDQHQDDDADTQQNSNRIIH